MTARGQLPHCGDCVREWSHCHDIVLVHVTGELECGNGDCELVLDLHEHVVACADPCCSDAPQRPAATA